MSPAAAARREEPVVDAVLRLPGGATIEGQLVGLGTRDVTILCERRGTPSTEPGGRLEVVLRGAAVGGEKVAPGHVDRDLEVDDLRRITVRYLDEDDFRELVQSGVGRLFNRRGAYRVRPSARLSAEADLLAPVALDWKRVTVTDVSVTGIGLLVPHEAGLGVSKGDAAELTLHLATFPHPTVFGGRVRNVVENPEGVRLGIDLDPFRTVNFEAAQDRLRDYIMRRQREMLRSRHLRSAD